nr:hypothetical protein [Tanacetum cinerariifolium]
MERLKGEIGSMVHSCEGSSRVSRRRRYNCLHENLSRKLMVRSYNRSRVPRLRWTNELHQCFVNAVQRLGGEKRATPKMVLQMFNVKALTMFRSMKNEVILQETSVIEQAESCNDNAYKDPENAQELISASFSSSTAVDIELTLGGPNAALRSSCANCKR